MGKKTSIWIMTILFGSGIFAAYHADTHNAAKNKTAHVEYQSGRMNI